VLTAAIAARPRTGRQLAPRPGWSADLTAPAGGRSPAPAGDPQLGL